MDLPQESRVSPDNSSSQPPRQHHHGHQPQQHLRPHSQEPHHSSHPSLPPSSSVTQPSRPASRPDMYNEDNADIRDPWPRTPLSFYASSPGFRHTSVLARPVYYDQGTYQMDRYKQGQPTPYNDYPHTPSSPYREPYHPPDRHSRGDLPPKDHLGRDGFPSTSAYMHQPHNSNARPSSAPSQPSSSHYPSTRTEAIGRDEGRSTLSHDSRHLQYNERRYSQQQRLPHNQQNQSCYECGCHPNNSQTGHHHPHQQQHGYDSNIAPDVLVHNHTPHRPRFDHFADSRSDSTQALARKGATSMPTPLSSTSTAVSISSSKAMAATTSSLAQSASEGPEAREGRGGPSHSDSATAHVLSDYARPDPGTADTRAGDRAYEKSNLMLEGAHRLCLTSSSSSSTSLSPAHDDPLRQRPPSQQWHHQGAVSVHKRDARDDGDERRYSVNPRWNDPKYPKYPSASASASGYLKSGPPYSPSTTHTHTHARLQHHTWDGAEPGDSPAHLPSPTNSSSSAYTPPLSNHASASYLQPSLPSSLATQQHRPTSIPHLEDLRQELDLQADPNRESNDEDEVKDEGEDEGDSWQSAKNLGFKFGTEMPTTIDLKAAIDSCDTLCKFALHYAQSQDSHPQGYPGPDSLLLQENERTTLQVIRSMNSAMLLGLRVNKECDKEGKENKESEDKETKEGGHDPSKSASSEPDFDLESSIKFGPGAPSDKMVHELARAATSIFQLAIRIKAWVNMTPEERELDEEINIIRGKRCLVMDGSSSLPPMDHVGHPQMDWAMLQAKSTFHTPMEKRVQNQESTSKGVDPMDIDRPFEGAGERLYDGHVSFALAGSGSKAKSKAMKAGNSSKDESVPHQKYRKRAKRTHPPGRCMSCDSSDTPEWRRGPDGARTLCNACGLHYAKLLKRQNKEHKTKQAQQLQFISFPFRKRAKSQSSEAHHDGSKEPGAMPEENDHPLEQEQHPHQDMEVKAEQQQLPSSARQSSETPVASMENTEHIPTIAPMPAS